MWAVIARSLISWFPVDQGSQVYQVLFKVTEPIVDPIRKVMPNTGMIDMSPMIAIMGLIAMQYMVAMLVAA